MTQAAAPNRIVVGVIGTGGMGSAHLRNLTKRDDVEIAYVCDVDQQRLNRAAETAHAVNQDVKPVRDLRHLLDDPRLDAVVIATPDHWHAPAAILALDAGKHVYVEKPCCHNIQEGRLMTAAVRRSQNVLQVGTQSRSAPFLQDAIRRIHEGAIGEVLVAKAWNSQRRRSIGKTEPSDPPDDLDFDLWGWTSTQSTLSTKHVARNLALVVRLRLWRHWQRRRTRSRRGALGFGRANTPVNHHLLGWQVSLRR